MPSANFASIDPSEYSLYGMPLTTPDLRTEIARSRIARRRRRMRDVGGLQRLNRHHVGDLGAIGAGDASTARDGRGPFGHSASSSGIPAAPLPFLLEYCATVSTVASETASGIAATDGAFLPAATAVASDLDSKPSRAATPG